MKKNIIISSLFLSTVIFAQNKGLVANSESPYSKLQSVGLQDVKWTKGFWKEQFDVETKNTLPYMWDLYHNETSHAYKNFEIAAGLSKGTFKGPSFHDGDFYKIFEGMAATYAVTKDKKLDAEMDKAIALFAKVQRKDGYIHTPVLIDERWGTLGPEEVKKQLGFEKYNMGHLMTAACIHYRATGKTNFLNIAKGVADFLYDFYKKASPELARNAICPSHYMGIVEMYRTTKNPKYLELANNLIDIRGTTNDGTDDNQDRVPFRQQTTAMGHAVRANYLYAGVADLYAETGEKKLLDNLESIWDDVTYRKMYITGGCGSLYDGVSPDGTSYDPTVVQKIHQAYGRPFQLPNATAHTETCANIGNVLWNWRMLQITGDAKYADIVELALYNSVLSGMDLEGEKFLYNNPLNVSNDLPFHQRWGNEREGYIALSNCCAPNVTRTIAEVGNYAYNISKEGLYVNLYGSNQLKTKSLNGEEIEIEQQTNYPWDGKITLKIVKAPKDLQNFFLRIPGWSQNASISVNNSKITDKIVSGTYLKLNQKWKKGDVIELNLPMPVELMEANPLVEEVKNQVAVKRGPLVYCLESDQLPAKISVNDVALNVKSKFTTNNFTLNNRNLVSIDAEAVLNSNNSWNKTLYKPLSSKDATVVSVKLIPYFAWGNKGKGEMTVWMSH
ncbi:glycoside hydrolase family 127 protein [Flavobacterium sp. WLB]|uniref:aceric acid hydrolase n=1 Tax=unclassified Flavobacterium TaxID=196869 RepID=UPI0006ABD362|nr:MULTISPECIES: glycoside hydrolase family 127 protein [unclassified Flavobacterium]KOP38223.1 ATP-binding protein [Flavobacterium sp. VMW]OWU92279.1 ATP-binding protein [Flavobacterium sp. NLM]PUU70778.1 glycoside hydrolase family 127 protein [Flavobacterium sp. WLB]